LTSQKLDFVPSNAGKQLNFFFDLQNTRGTKKQSTYYISIEIPSYVTWAPTVGRLIKTRFECE